MSVLFFDSPIGVLCARETSGALTKLDFPFPDARKLADLDAAELRRTALEFAKDEPGETPLLRRVGEQLEEYFAGDRREFEIEALGLGGTPFQRAVWKALIRVPYGTTTTYGALAERAGSPKASRAVGMAMHDNPVVIIVPCHRVLGKSGALTGYSAGLSRKEYLLAHERRVAGGSSPLLFPGEPL